MICKGGGEEEVKDDSQASDLAVGTQQKEELWGEINETHFGYVTFGSRWRIWCAVQYEDLKLQAEAWARDTIWKPSEYLQPSHL